MRYTLASHLAAFYENVTIVPSRFGGDFACFRVRTINSRPRWYFWNFLVCHRLPALRWVDRVLGWAKISSPKLKRVTLGCRPSQSGRLFCFVPKAKLLYYINNPLLSLILFSMDQSAKMTPKDFFLNLGVVVTLYTSAITFLTLLFEIIDRVFPDALSQGYYSYGYYSSGIRFAIASLVIMFPLCILISVLNNREAVLVPEKKKLAIRRWLSYVTLFITSLAMAIDLITLINTFLGGEITARFTFKVLSVFLVCAVIFGYYIYDLRAETPGGKGPRIFAGVISFLVFAGIVGGFLIIGSPFTQRLRLFDERRVNDLQNIQWQVVNFWQKKGMLPKTLFELTDSISGYSVPTDPRGEDYEYEVAGLPLTFKLCATFELSTEEVRGKEYTRKDGSKPYSTTLIEGYYPYSGDTWTHAKGRTCFDRTIDPGLYPVIPPPSKTVY